MSGGGAQISILKGLAREYLQREERTGNWRESAPRERTEMMVERAAAGTEFCAAARVRVVSARARVVPVLLRRLLGRSSPRLQ
jgi:hypothetical protein